MSDNDVPVKVDTCTADEEISKSMLLYSEDVLRTRLPHFADGCKNIIRRIVWFNRDALALRPMNKMVGDLQDVHTSGDKSISEALLRLGQYYNVGHPLIEISGKSGEYYDSDAAAATRYLSSRLSDFAYDVYFKGVNTDSLQMMPTKNSDHLEPRYMIPKIPMALVLGNLTVGVAYKSDVPMIDISQVCALVMHYAKYYQSGGIGMPAYERIAKYCIPSYPIKNNILNRSELLAAYKEGKFDTPIRVEGWVDVSGNSLTLRTMPYGTNFGAVVNEFRALLKDPKNKFRNFVDSANNYSSDEAEFTITLKSGKNPFEALDALRTVLHINNTSHPIFNYVKDDRVVMLIPPVLTYLWYKEREANITIGLNHTQTSLNATVMRLNAILLVIDYSQDVLKIITESTDEAETIERLVERFTDLNLTRNQASIIAKQPLSIFNKNSKANLKNRLEQACIDLDNVMHNYGRVHETIQNDAAYIQKRYESTSQTVYSDDYLGYVQFGNWGLINFFNYDEMKNILATRGWPSQMVKTIHLYDKKRPRRVAIRNGRAVELKYVSKEVTCERLVCYSNNLTAELTLVISNKGSVSIIERVVDTVHEGFTLCPITPRFYAIHANGIISVENYRDYTIRKSVSSGRQSSVVYGLPIQTKDVVIFYMNDEEPNQLRISRILSGNDTGRQIKFSPCGKTYIIGVYPTSQAEIILNIPKECLKSIKLNHVIMHDLAQLFKTKNKDYFGLNLSRGKSDIGVKLKQDTAISTLFHLDFNQLS